MKRKYGTQTAKTFRTLFLLLFIIFAVEPRAYADEITLIPVGTTIGITVSIKGVSVMPTLRGRTENYVRPPKTQAFSRATE